MRGNEKAKRWKDVFAEVFPIPMRDNEVVCIEAGLLPDGVSNPHEG